jgi:hypothetical protein
VSKFLRAFTILSQKAKRRMFLLFPVIIVGMALETLSVGMVLPALGILMSETYFEKFPALIPLLDYLGNPSHKELIFPSSMPRHFRLQCTARDLSKFI